MTAKSISSIVSFTLMVLFSAICVFHFLALFQVIPFDILWGGRLKNKEDLIRVARDKMNPDSFTNWWKKAEKKDIGMQKRRKEEEAFKKVLNYQGKQKRNEIYNRRVKVGRNLHELF